MSEQNTSSEDSEEARRRREMNMFATMALGGETPAAGFGATNFGGSGDDDSIERLKKEDGLSATGDERSKRMGSKDTKSGSAGFDFLAAVHATHEEDIIPRAKKVETPALPASDSFDFRAAVAAANESDFVVPKKVAETTAPAPAFDFMAAVAAANDDDGIVSKRKQTAAPAPAPPAFDFQAAIAASHGDDDVVIPKKKEDSTPAPAFDFRAAIQANTDNDNEIISQKKEASAPAPAPAFDFRAAIQANNNDDEIVTKKEEKPAPAFDFMAAVSASYGDNEIVSKKEDTPIPTPAPAFDFMAAVAAANDEDGIVSKKKIAPAANDDDGMVAKKKDVPAATPAKDGLVVKRRYLKKDTQAATSATASATAPAPAPPAFDFMAAVAASHGEGETVSKKEETPAAAPAFDFMAAVAAANDNDGIVSKKNDSPATTSAPAPAFDFMAHVAAANQDDGMVSKQKTAPTPAPGPPAFDFMAAVAAANDDGFVSKKSDKPASTATNNACNLFSQAVSTDAGNSGTFNFSASAAANKKESSEAERSNLEAAVAALSKTDNPNRENQTDNQARAPIQLPHHLMEQQKNAAPSSTSPQSETGEIPMFAEEVVVPRPLFYGAIVPPRVLREARAMVREAVEEYYTIQENLQETTSIKKPKIQQPRLFELPVEVRNVVGALRTYGHGLLGEVLKEMSVTYDSKTMKDYKDEHVDCKGSPYVSTFQPVWGSDIRAERVKEYKRIKRPKAWTANDRVTTAPARMLASLSPTGDDHHHSSSMMNMIVEQDDNISQLGEIYEDDELENEIKERTQPLLGKTVATSTATSVTTETGQCTAEESKSEPQTVSAPLVVANEQFSAWLRSDDDSFLGNASAESVSSFRSLEESLTSPKKKKGAVVEIPNATAADENVNNNQATSALSSENNPLVPVKKAPLSEQELFSQWACGGDMADAGDSTTKFGSIAITNNADHDKVRDPIKSGIDAFSALANASTAGGTFIQTGGTFVQTGTNAMNTFQRIPQRPVADSDDDSVIDDEQKKQVGVNDHLSKAIALLAQDGVPSSNDVSAIEQSQVLLSQVAQDGSRKRPLTNFELTSGCVPLFGVDDAPLPQEADLGIHETKEEQQRANEQKRSQEIIEKFVSPNIFGPVACPNPATSPDDFHSWQSRVMPPSVTTTGVAPSRIQTNMSRDSISSEISGIHSVPNTGDLNPPKRQYHSYGSAPNGIGIETTPLRGNAYRSRSEGNNFDAPMNRQAIPNQQQQNPQSVHSKPRRHGNRRSGEVQPPTTTETVPRNITKRPSTSRGRFGWWNSNEDKEGQETPQSLSGMPEGGDKKSDDETLENKLQIPPIHHSSIGVQVITNLEPTPAQLRKDNLPLSRLHAATTMVQSIPYLSDRPHSYRYLQIETQAIAFPPIKGEIEPFFCSIAIYNVETISNTQATGGSSKTKPAPIPDLQRCGRVTEALYFDHVADPDIARRFSNSLFPYSKHNLPEGSVADAQNSNNEQPKMQGTRCGVFPLPSNLNVANLYAVLIVRKVISEEPDLEPYVKPNKSIVDIEKHRSTAEKNSNRHGTFLMPFAFGAAPLLQVFGTDNPLVASSRAVQIPLFRFSDSERQIIDHIMVMLYPKANHKVNGINGPAPVTNGGTAMLVMRNFGYLGLHTVVDSKSKLARDRLVDFTGELQVRRQTETEKDEKHREKPEQVDGYKLVLPDWHPQFIAEPTKDGGRYTVNNTQPEGNDTTLSTSKSYAQELAPLPLQLAPFSKLNQTGMPRVRPTQDDIEPFYHTTFCNELLCHPRILHNSRKGNTAIKVELRDIEWSEEHNGYLAHLPSCGPSVHNTRRGPFLVQSAFTSCSSRRTHQFLDEFKVKLPLSLKPKKREGVLRTLSIFFTVYRIKLNSKSKWKTQLLPSKKKNGEGVPEVIEQEVSGRTRLDQVSCGFLPITLQGCLIDNGMHDVRIVYKARSLSQEMIGDGFGENSTLILKEQNIEESNLHVKEDSYAEETTVSDTSFVSERIGDSSVRNDGSSEIAGVLDDSQSLKGPKGKTIIEPISLAVRIVVHSSVHSQNNTLNDFLSHETDVPLLSQLPNKVFLSTLRMGRDYLSKNTGLDVGRNKPSALDEKLMESTIAITDHQLCSVSRSSGHLLRVMSRLWRSLVCGNGEPSLAWANPATPTPLRVHSFATIVHLVGATSLYLSKHGVTQLDGLKKWNVVTFGRVLALVFDESNMFGSQGIEKFDDSYWSSPEVLNPSPMRRKTSAKKKPIQRRRRHVRNNFDLSFNDMPQVVQPKPSLGLEFLSSSAGDLASPPPKKPSTSHISTTATNIDIAAVKEDELSPKKDRKLDSKMDFQQALRAADSEEDDDLHTADRGVGSGGGIRLGFGSEGNSQLKTFTGSGAARRYGTMPPMTLSTIKESDFCEDSGTELNCGEEDFSPTPIEEILKTEAEPLNLNTSLETVTITPVMDPAPEPFHEDVVSTIPKSRTKQMRRPRTKPKKKEDDANKSDDAPAVPLVLTSDDEIERSGTAFLESIGSSLGFSLTIATPDEGKSIRPTYNRNRKNPSRSSIDWSLMSDNTTPTQPVVEEEPAEEVEELGEEDEDEKLSTLKNENTSYVRLPNFVDRLEILGKLSAEENRWFPYAYEVIIMQWAAILIEQRKSGEKKSSDRSSGHPKNKEGAGSDKSLSQAALRSVGVAVAGAPMLFEVIKQSLGFRIKVLFNGVVSLKGARTTPPLAILDSVLMMHLEQVISMVADACIDARNFDSWELRQMSIDVNDAIVHFLRDLFSFLAPSSVHRLILAYLSRFITKEGKHTSDRDSLIGLRCSWEISKLRLNAITALVRFPDFIKVNGPQMLNWTNWWTTSPSRVSSKFYDDVLDRYQTLRLPAFTGSEDSKKAITEFPSMRPHWLAEIVVDICLLGTEHAEQYIQHRSASLLHELFWSCSQESIFSGISAPVASMFVTYLEKIVAHGSYLANFSPKSQLRKDVLLCAIFVMQSAPQNLLRALWRRLIRRMPGRGLDKKYFGDFDSGNPPVEESEAQSKLPSDLKEEPNVLGLFSVLNLALRTVEYEGCDEHSEPDTSGESRENLELWRREYLLCNSKIGSSENRGRRVKESKKTSESDYKSSTSRKWQAHDGSMVIINAGHNIVREIYGMLRSSPNGKFLLNPAVQHNGAPTHIRPSYEEDAAKTKNFSMTKAETILFVRAATSLYLHALALRESDVVLDRTFLYSAEVIKIFGITTFLEAVGETLQHWMRVISFHCGARRAQVRIEATDLLELILRSTWECYGSFFRIRVPLLAVQTEVMERIVATAAARYYKEQRRMGTSFEAFSNLGAEASLVPLWRTLDRIQKQPASQNIAFRGALIRIAGKLKKLYRAYVAARVLSFIKGAKEKNSLDENPEKRNFELEAIVRANRINILRVINASEGHSKQFLGFQGTSQQRSSVAHFEAVEDALIDAANVFTPTELPEHRVAWLRMLAEFHSSRKKFAEEATCHYQIHVTLHLAARLHGSLWSNTPFLPWTDNIPDPVVYIDGDANPPEPDFTSDMVYYETNDLEYGKRMENATSFRRIFYRVANSIGMGNGEWELGASKNLFYGVTFPDEYYTVNSWITLREMEENMAEEVESAGHLFLNAGIIESSRFAWSLATQFYSEKFNYAKLSNAYSNLAKAVVSQVPSIDTSLPQEMSATLGRFYRVWFHGGAPDELSGVEFVYRTQGNVPLKKFGEELRDVIKSIIPDKTPIHLVLDGLGEERLEDSSASYGGFSRIGPAPLEPVRIKVTPLRPLFGKDNRTRGLPEWFNDYVDEAFSGPAHRKNDVTQRETGRRNEPYSRSNGEMNDPHHHDRFRSLSATMFSSGSSTTAFTSRRSGLQTVGNADRAVRFSAPRDSNLQGVDKFCFLQSRDRSKGSKEWWKSSSGDFSEKSLKITQLQVTQSFPACVARQAVVHRLVYTQSPLEAGVDAICQWCAVLFRTAVATSGMAVLKTNFEPGIGTDAAKVVADCIHGSHVKDIGVALLKKDSDLMEGDNSIDFAMDFDRLSDDEVKKFQLKLARLIVTFVELLHLLIARNRDLLLSVIQERKKNNDLLGNIGTGGGSVGRGFGRAPSLGQKDASRLAKGGTGGASNHKRSLTDSNQSDNGRLEGRSHTPTVSQDHQSYQSMITAAGVRTDSAIAVQSELQRAFIKLTKDLYPRVQGIMLSDTPRWLKQCTQDNYFSLGLYRQTSIPIAEELCFSAADSGHGEPARRNRGYSHYSQSEHGYESPRGSIGGASQSSVISRGSDRYSLNQI